MTRNPIDNEAAARAELPPGTAPLAWREGRPALPFHELSPDQFEILSFLLLQREFPGDRIYYYGKTGDAGRDIIHIVDGRHRLIQCKNYSQKLGVAEIRPELAKVCYNTFSGKLIEPVDAITFYLAPDVTADGADLIRFQARWREDARESLQRHTRKVPDDQLLQYAHEWWPDPDFVTALSLTTRLQRFPDLLEEFFAVRKVIDASLDQVREAFREEGRLLVASVAGHGCESAVGPERVAIDPLALLDDLRDVSSPLLQWPTTLGTEPWQDRAELHAIKHKVREEDFSTTLLIGPPGCGKSALLARLGNDLSEEKIPVLALKADRLDLVISDLATLSEQLLLPADVVDCVDALARNGRVVVLIDQLDALADLVDLRSGRLNALLQLIKRLSGRLNVHVVASCRAFEHGHDVRLTSIEAEIVPLGLLEWESVAAILQARGLNTSAWPTEFRELLRAPQHLKIFLDRLRGGAEDRVFTTYQQLLDDLWGRCVLGPGGNTMRSRLLEEMAAVMAERETLWLPLARYEAHTQAIIALEAQGVLMLSENRLQVGFRHQTLFDHARARSFASERADLAGDVLARQDGLFVRPLLWSGLNYLRLAAPGTYEQTVTRLIQAQPRKHVQHLLIDFLGQITTTPPTEAEQRWLIAYLRQPETRPKVLGAIRGNPAWFSLLHRSHLPAVMALPPGEAWPVVWVISSAWETHRTECIELLESNWMPDQARDELTWSALSQLPVWSDETLALARRILTRTPIGISAVSSVTGLIAERQPEVAARLIRLRLEVELSRLDAQGTTDMDRQVGLVEDDIACTPFGVESHQQARYELLLSERQGLYGLDLLAEEAPVEFLDNLWPWFVQVLERLEGPQERVLVRYRRERTLATEMDEEVPLRCPVIAAVEIAVRGTAARDVNRFLQLLQAEGGRDSLAVQRLLCRGILALGATHAALGLSFLLEDPRRLALGPHADAYQDTCELITAVAPHLTADQVGQLERAILGWRRYRTSSPEIPAEDRFVRNRYERRHRLRLLRSIGTDLLSAETRSFARTEETALPGYESSGVMRYESGVVDSPMSAEEMALAQDDDIRNLFRTLPQRLQSPHRSYLTGGLIEVSRAFGEFSRANPVRAERILRTLRPGEYDLIVASGLLGVSEAGTPDADFLTLIRDLDRSGFTSHEFRQAAAQGLSKRVRANVGLPDSVCEVLESWLQSPWPAGSQPACRAGDNEDPCRSLIWGRGHLQACPTGVTDLLHALTLGYFRRQPPEPARWLACLEELVGRFDDPVTWGACTRELSCLRHCEPNRATAFVARLLERVPSLLSSVNGVHLLTHLWWFLPDEDVRRLLECLRDGAWDEGPQAFGELLALRRLDFPADEWALLQLNCELAGAQVSERTSRIRLGLAHTAARFWGESTHHRVASEVLTRLARVADQATARAMMTAFNQGDALIIDAPTLAFLGSILENETLLRQGYGESFVEQLQDLVTAEPELAHALAEAVVRVRGAEMADYRTSMVPATAHLTNLALTLQRLGGTHRANGLHLFEALLDLGVQDAQAALNEIDRRPLGSPSRIRTPRRRTRPSRARRRSR